MALSPQEEAEFQELSKEFGSSALERTGRNLLNLPYRGAEVLGRSVIGLKGLLSGLDEGQIKQTQGDFSDWLGQTHLQVDRPKGAPTTLPQQATDLVVGDAAPQLAAAIAVPLKAPGSLLGRVGTETARGALLGAQTGTPSGVAKSALMFGATGGIAGAGPATARGLLARTAAQGALPYAEEGVYSTLEDRPYNAREATINAAVQAGLGALTDPTTGRAVRGLFRRAPVAEPINEVPPTPQQQGPAPDEARPPLRTREEVGPVTESPILPETPVEVPQPKPAILALQRNLEAAQADYSAARAIGDADAVAEAEHTLTVIRRALNREQAPQVSPGPEQIGTRTAIQDVSASPESLPEQSAGLRQLQGSREGSVNPTRAIPNEVSPESSVNVPSIQGAENPIAPTLYRESSVRDAMSFLSQNTSHDLRDTSVFMATSPELALGQGKNKGIMLEFNPSGLSLRDNASKPGTGFANEVGGAKERIGLGNTQQQYQDSVSAIQFRPSELPDLFSRRMVANLSKELEFKGWKKTVKGDTVRFEKPKGFKLPPQNAGFVNPSLLTGAAGGTLGSVYGYATGEDEQDRRLRAAEFGALGLAAGAGLPRLVGAGRRILQRSTLPRESGPVSPTEPALREEVPARSSGPENIEEGPGFNPQIQQAEDRIMSLLRQHKLETDPAKQAAIWEEALRLQDETYKPKGMMKRRPDEGGYVSGTLLNTLGGGAAGAITGYTLGSNDEDRRRLAIMGGLGGALLGGVLTNKADIKRGLLSRQAKLKNTTQVTPADKVADWAGKWLNAGRQDETLRAISRSQGRTNVTRDDVQGVASQLRTPELEAYRANPAHVTSADTFVTSAGSSADVASLRASGLDPKVADTLVASKQAQIAAQEELSKANVGERKNVIDKTLGTYGRRAYGIDIKPESWVRDDALFQKVVDQWHASTPGVSRPEVERFVDQYLAARKNGIEFKPDLSEKMSGKLFTARKPLTPELRDLLGEVKDPVERQLLTTQKLLGSMKQAAFINEISGTKRADGLPLANTSAELQAARAAGKDVSEYVQLGDSPGYGKLAGKYVPVDVARQLEAPPKEWFEKLSQTMFGKATGWTKEAVTVANLATHARQLIQTPLMMIAGRGNAKLIPDMVKALANPNSPEARMLREEGVLGANYAHNEFAKLVPKLGKSLSPLAKARSLARNLYALPDDSVRALTYLTALKRFKGDRNAALDWTNRFTMNYSTQNRAVNAGRQLPIVSPFISFSSELLRVSRNLANEVLTGKSLVDKAHAAAGLAALFGVGVGVDAYTRSRLSEKDRKEWDQIEKLLPDYTKYQAKLVMGKNKTGGRDFIGTSSLTPGGDLLSLAKMVSAGDWDAVIKQNPFIGLKAPLASAFVDVVQGRNDFTGQDLEGTDRAMRLVEPFIPPQVPGLGYEGKKLTQLVQSGGEWSDPYSGRLDTTGRAAARNLLGVNVQSAKREPLLRRANFEADQKDRKLMSRQKAELRTASTPQQRKQIAQKYTGLRRENREEQRRLIR